MREPRGRLVAALIVAALVVCAGGIGIALAIGRSLLAGCQDSDPDRRLMAGAPVRTELEPLRKVFPRLDRMVSAHWQHELAGADCWVPGPSDIMIQAIVVLPADDLATITTGYAWQPVGTGWDRRLSDGLRPFVPGMADWRLSPGFEAEALGSLYSGSVYFDLRSGTVYLNAFTS